MRLTVSLLAAVMALTSCATKPDRDTLYQVSLIDALLAGEYDGLVTLEDLSTHGDFGLGTFDRLDGEMVVLNGVCHQALSTGDVLQPAGTGTTPFAAVTFFDVDGTLPLGAVESLEDLGTAVDARLPTENAFYAIRIEGAFETLRIRSVPPQMPPYRPLADVVPEQAVWDLAEISGTLVGLRCPPFAAGLNVPGHHWHFISADGQHGGHVLALSASSLMAEIDVTPRWEIWLPDTPGFQSLDLGQSREEALHTVER